MEIGYHGSGSSISFFTEDKVGIGADSNGEDVIFVCLNPKEAVIVARLSPEQADCLNDALFDGAGVMVLLGRGRLEF